MLDLLNLPDRDPDLRPVERKAPAIAAPVVVVRVDLDDDAAARAIAVVRWCPGCLARVVKRPASTCGRRCCR